MKNLQEILDDISFIDDRVYKDPNSGCWLWLGALQSQGYGSVWRRGKWYRAHRLSFEAHTRTSPDGMVVCHKCDNPPCVNPDHLWLGTMKDNQSDMSRKGRAVHCGTRKDGEKRNSKWKDKWPEVLSRIDAGQKHADISKAMGIPLKTVGKIKHIRKRDLLCKTH